jgi:hypothetical protein
VGKYSYTPFRYLYQSYQYWRFPLLSRAEYIAPLRLPSPTFLTRSQGNTAQELIISAVSGSLGTVMVDNYKPNRWLGNDDPELVRQK